MRITGGILGGRRLDVPKGGVRPTQDRVREAIFSSLAAGWSGSRVLDLYAGSGSLGVEAWSRGAETVIWVERDSRVFRALRGNVARLCGEEAARGCRCADVFSFLRQAGGPFDFVLADPPYDRHTVSFDPVRLLDALRARGLMAPDGVLVLEQRAGTPVPDCRGWVLKRHRDYGETGVYIYGTDPQADNKDIR